MVDASGDSALAVRVDRVDSVLNAEKEREQSLNLRAIALTAASLVLAGLFGRTLSTAIHSRHHLADHVLDGAAGVFVGSVLLTIAVAVFGVLRPVVRTDVDPDELTHWLSNAGVAETADEARKTIIRAAELALRSGCKVNERKAKCLRAAYLFQATTLAAAAVMLVTLIV